METVSWFAGAPFVILLLLIAVMPLALPRFWESNRNKAIVTALVSLPILWYMLGSFPQELAHNLIDYLKFIALLGSLFIISGGILITGDVRATPAVNTLYLAVGAVIANLIGTTGASMLLIRPMLRTNQERKVIGHIPVFFIFIVSNIGGCLTPIGDPPLFLGYLKGVPFAWTLGLWPEWLITVGIVLAVFYYIDTRCYRKERPADIKHDIREVVKIRLAGTINLLFLAGVVLAVASQTPSPYRELIMGIMTGLSLWLTKSRLRKANRFTFHPICEVAVLFAGIFITMVPLLMLLRLHGAEFGLTRPWQFFWLTGGLSSFLDNAPTYLAFFSMAQSVTEAAAAAGPVVAGVSVDLLRAISCGAVFMGAMTYIGNGPNFMVKSIAEEQKVPVPSFHMYMVYSSAILLPVFVLITFIFFRG
jgi:Na+/H+ antiporter NhaD/arsenite permease-like protein